MALTKAKYIEKYGEEAWIAEAQKRKEKAQKYYNEHKDQYRKNGKKWREANRGKRREIDKRSHKKHREERLEYARQYRINNHEKVRTREIQFRIDHKEEVLERSRKYDNKRRSTQKGRSKDLLHAYRQIDIKDNRGNCTLTAKWIIDNIFNSSCIYCGDSDWTHLGADRIDNSKPHTPENCVCACGICNIERSDKYTVEEFKEYRKTHPRFSPDQKSWEIIELNGLKVLKKRAIN